MVIIKLKRAVKKAKKAAAPFPVVAFLPNITHPLASAKSAIDHIKKNTMTMAESI